MHIAVQVNLLQHIRQCCFTREIIPIILLSEYHLLIDRSARVAALFQYTLCVCIAEECVATKKQRLNLVSSCAFALLLDPTISS